MSVPAARPWEALVAAEQPMVLAPVDHAFRGSVRKSSGALLTAQGVGSVTRVSASADKFVVELVLPGVGSLRVSVASADFTNAAKTWYAERDPPAPSLPVHAPPTLAPMRAHILALEQALVITPVESALPDRCINSDPSAADARLVFLFAPVFFAAMFEASAHQLGGLDSLLLLPQLTARAAAQQLESLHADRTRGRPHDSVEAVRDRAILRYVALVQFGSITDNKKQKPSRSLFYSHSTLKSRCSSMNRTCLPALCTAETAGAPVALTRMCVCRSGSGVCVKGVGTE